jgi:hypothetical protein
VTFSGTQTLASLADGEYTDPSDAIDNGTIKAAYADFELYLNTMDPSTTGYVELFVIPQVDGTNYADFTGNTTTTNATNDNYRSAWGGIEDSNAAHRIQFKDVVITNGNFKVAIRNRGGAAFNATSNTLKFRRHDGSYT